MKEILYDREKVYEYAKKWAYGRNPQYYNFDNVGGDCTSFVSQCIFSGAKVMNYSTNNGWYYINGNRKSPSWSGVEFLYNFLVKNKLTGPYGKETNNENIEIGDIVQISFDGEKFEHSVVIVDIEDKFDMNKIYIASHTYDSFYKALSEYDYDKLRFIHIDGVRI